MNVILSVPGGWRLFVEPVDGVRAAEWAVRALERGLDTPHLRWLAGLEPGASSFEVGPILQRVMQELRVEPTSEGWRGVIIYGKWRPKCSQGPYPLTRHSTKSIEPLCLL